jgi:integrase
MQARASDTGADADNCVSDFTGKNADISLGCSAQAPRYCETGDSGTATVPHGAYSQLIVPNGPRPRPGWEDILANSGLQARTLEDVREAMRASGPNDSDKVCAFNSLERICGIPLARIPLDYDHIRKVLADVSPISKGLNYRTWLNIRSRCNVAIKRVMAGNVPPPPPKSPLSDAWKALKTRLKPNHEQHTLSGFIEWANTQGLRPIDVDNNAFLDFDNYRGDNLREDAKRYRRGRVKIWNDLGAKCPDFGLVHITVHPISRHCTQIRWNELPVTLQNHTDCYLSWAGASNPFDPDAREKPLSATTLAKHKNWLLAAADTLVKSGVPASSIRTLNDLVSPDRVLTILKARLLKASGKHTTHNFHVGRTLLQVAAWLGLADDEVAEVRKIVACLKSPPSQMAPKNLKTIRPFGNPELKARLVRLPEQLFAEARRDLGYRRSRLSKLQAALAIAVLTLFAIRIKNLASLSFEVHVDLNEHCPTLFIPAEEVKNDVPLEFDIPPYLVALLREYRDELFPKLTGFQPVQLFADMDGHRKGDQAIREFVKKFTKHYLSAQINPHAFRHLAANAILDHSPGAYPLVQNLLGHTSSRTTADFYAGPNTLRAGRHHVKLLMNDLQA